jgi:hypothetical protein
MSFLASWPSNIQSTPTKEHVAAWLSKAARSDGGIVVALHNVLLRLQAEFIQGNREHPDTGAVRQQQQQEEELLLRRNEIHRLASCCRERDTELAQLRDRLREYEAAQSTRTLEETRSQCVHLQQTCQLQQVQLQSSHTELDRMTNQAEKTLQRAERAKAKTQAQAHQLQAMEAEFEALRAESKTLRVKANKSQEKEQ